MNATLPTALLAAPSQELEREARQKPQGRLQDLADFVIPDGVLTHEHNCTDFVLGGIRLAEQALRGGQPIQMVRCRGEVLFFVGTHHDVWQRIQNLPDIPPSPDPHPDEGWDDED